MTNTFKGNKLIHIPVTITPEDQMYKYPINDPNGKECSWWTPNPLLKYDAMLMSAYHAMWNTPSQWNPNNKNVKFLKGVGGVNDRHDFNIRDDVLFFGDSGGFQVLQESLKDPNDPNVKIDYNIFERLTPERVIDWQMDVCDIGMTLDIPTPRTWNDRHNHDILEDRLNRSDANARVMCHRLREAQKEGRGEQLKLFNCVHGINLKDMRQWHNVTSGPGWSGIKNNDGSKNTEVMDYVPDYDGYSLAISQDMKYLIALRLGFAIENSKGRPFHMLGVSAPQALALIAYANKYTDTQIYFDSSSASTGRMIRKYMLFYDMASNGVVMGEHNSKYKLTETLECPCPICSQLKDPSDLWAHKTISGILITLHNLYWMTNYTAFINNLVKWEDDFKAYARRLTKSPADTPNGPTSTDSINNDSMSSEEITGMSDFGFEVNKAAPGMGVPWVMLYMDFMDMVVDKGLDFAYSQYIEPSGTSNEHIYKNHEDLKAVEVETALNVETNKRLETVFVKADDYATRQQKERERKNKEDKERIERALARAETGKKGEKPAKLVHIPPQKVEPVKPIAIQPATPQYAPLFSSIVKQPVNNESTKDEITEKKKRGRKVDKEVPLEVTYIGNVTTITAQTSTEDIEQWY